MAGDRPSVELAAGVVTLRNRESWLARRFNRHYGRFRDPQAEVSIRVGIRIGAIVEDGDVLCIGRDGTGDHSLQIHRDDSLVAAIGAVAGSVSKRHATVEEDPRAYETRLYGIMRMLAEPETAFVWLDASDPDLSERITAVHQITGKTKIVLAIAGRTAAERIAVNHRVGQSRGFGEPATWYYDVDERFETAEQWLAYLRTLPESRPTDLWIRIGVDGRSSVLREGEYAFESPWHLFVQRVYRRGVPGDLSQLAIVREHPSLTRDDVIETTRQLAARDIRWR